MKNYSALITTAVFFCLVCAPVFTPSAMAAQYELLTPLFVDLENWNGQTQPTNVDSSAVLIKTSEIDGYQVMQRHVKADAEGVVIISISTSEQKPAAFMLNYTGLNADEALEHAKTFDWNQIKEVTSGIK